MRLVWLVIPLVFLGIIGVQESFAICIEDEDWPDKPCYAIPGEFFTSKEKQADWLEYYQYKGDDWLGEKNLEMNKNIEIKHIFFNTNSIVANVPSSFISELEKLDEVTYIDTFDKEITSFGNDVTSEKTSVQDESDDELILDIALDANSAQLSISGNAQNLKEIPIPDNVLGKEIDLLVNGVVENNFEIVSSSDDNQTLLTLHPILFQDTPIEENLPPISPLKQIKNGISPEDVICKEGLELIFKSTDGSPACVKPKTAEKLIERGWTAS